MASLRSLAARFHHGDSIQVSEWLLVRFGERIQRRRETEAEQLRDVPEFLL